VKELAIMVGLPLSGKSTFVKNLQNDFGYVIINPDTVRLALHGHQCIQNAEPFVWASVDLMVRTLLISSHKVVLDATNTTKFTRSRWVKMAKEFDLTLTIFEMSTPYDVVKQRNVILQRLDYSIIERMFNQYQKPDETEGLVREIDIPDNYYLACSGWK